MKIKNKILLYFGITILTIGIIINILMYVNEWYPTYLFFIVCGIGIIQIGISFLNLKIKKIWQLLWSILPFLIGLVYFQIAAPSKDIFLIPKGYIGKITIQYGQVDGQEKEFEGLWRIYRIPNNGILKTNFEIKGNSISLSDSKYYYVDKTGKRIKIDQSCIYCEEKDTVNIQVIYGIYGSNEKGIFQDFYINIPNNKFKRIK